MSAIGLLAIFLSVLPAAATASPTAPNQFVIDKAEPYVYIKFDNVGKREPATEGEGTEGLWLRLVILESAFGTPWCRYWVFEALRKSS